MFAIDPAFRYSVSVIPTAVFTALGAVALCVIVLYVLRRPGKIAPASAVSVSEISLDGYRAFSRLRSGADLKFLSAQPGYTDDIGERLRQEHARIARLYLREMRSDFETLCRAARAIAAASPVDRSDLVGTVEKERFRFYWRLAGVRVRAVLPGGGITEPAFAGLAESLARIQSAMEPAQTAAARF